MSLIARYTMQVKKVLLIFIAPNILLLFFILIVALVMPQINLSFFGVPVSAFAFSNKENATALNTTLNQVALLPTVSVSSSSLSLQNLNITWTTQNQPDINPHMFVGRIGTVPETEYYMFWQVGGGIYTRMYPKVSGAQTVNTTINFSTWKWNSDGPYELSFIVQDKTGKEIFRKKIAVKRYLVNGQTIMDLAGTQPTVITTPPIVVSTSTSPIIIDVPQPLPATTTPPTISPTSKLFTGKTLYLHPNQSTIQKQTFEAQNDPRSNLISMIANQPQAVWLTRGNDQDIQQVKDILTKTTSTNLPVFVIYAIPNRDCKSYSAGGVANENIYLAWIKKLSEVLGSKQAIIIYEPDALPQINCLTTLERTARLALIKESLKILSMQSTTSVYLDIGHPFWLTVDSAVNTLKLAGIQYVRGFSLNVSNYFSTANNVSYGEKISAQLNNIPFVIDTSRNGNGPSTGNVWCNPSLRALGNVPTFVTSHPRVDAYLWIKHPGESDGSCNGGPRAGVWWLEQALGYVSETQKLLH